MSNANRTPRRGFSCTGQVSLPGQRLDTELDRIYSAAQSEIPALVPRRPPMSQFLGGRYAKSVSRAFGVVSCPVEGPAAMVKPFNLDVHQKIYPLILLGLATEEFNGAARRLMSAPVESRTSRRCSHKLGEALCLFRLKPFWILRHPRSKVFFPDPAF